MILGTAAAIGIQAMRKKKMRTRRDCNPIFQVLNAEYCVQESLMLLFIACRFSLLDLREDLDCTYYL